MSPIVPALGLLVALGGAALSTLARDPDLRSILDWILLYGVLVGAASIGLRAAQAAGRTPLEPLGRLLGWIDRQLTPSGERALLAAMILAYTAVWTALSILRHLGLNSSGYDLAIQHQVVWNLAHGRGFESSIEVANYLGDHVAFTLALLAPLLWVWDDVRILLAAQSAILALGAVPVWRLARRRCEAPLEGLLWAGVYLLTPAVGFMNKYDLHDLVLALPLLLAAIEAIDRGRLRAASVWAALAMATREEVGIAVAALGAWLLASRASRRWGAAWGLGGVGYSLVALYLLIPHFRGGIASDTLARYVWLGGTPGRIARNLLTRPWILFSTPYHRIRRIVFPLQLLWPLGLFPLLAPLRALLALPSLALSIASSAISQNSIYFQYNAPILPFLFWSAIQGFHSSPARLGGRAGRLLLLLVGLATANLADPAAWKSVPRPYTIVDGVTPRENRDAFREAARRIPSDAPLLASNHLAPHFSARRALGVLHLARPNPPSDWIVCDLTDRRHLTNPTELARYLQGEIDASGFGVVFFRDGILLLSCVAPEDPEARRQAERALRSLSAARRGEDRDPGASSPSAIPAVR